MLGSQAICAWIAGGDLAAACLVGLTGFASCRAVD